MRMRSLGRSGDLETFRPTGPSIPAGSALRGRARSGDRDGARSCSLIELREVDPARLDCTSLLVGIESDIGV